MNTEYMLPTCEAHVINLSFTKTYTLPERVRKDWPRCAKRNCNAEARYWLVVELREAVFGVGDLAEPESQQSQLSLHAGLELGEGEDEQFVNEGSANESIEGRAILTSNVVPAGDFAMMSRNYLPSPLRPT